MGVSVVKRHSIETGLTPHNQNYLKTKLNRLGHLLSNQKLLAEPLFNAFRMPAASRPTRAIITSGFACASNLSVIRGQQIDAETRIHIKLSDS